jgi:hypothetical protein
MANTVKVPDPIRDFMFSALEAIAIFPVAGVVGIFSFPCCKVTAHEEKRNRTIHRIPVLRNLPFDIEIPSPKMIKIMLK